MISEIDLVIAQHRNRMELSLKPLVDAHRLSGTNLEKEWRKQEYAHSEISGKLEVATEALDQAMTLYECQVQTTLKDREEEVKAQDEQI